MDNKVVPVTFIDEGDELTDLAVLDGLSRLNNPKAPSRWLAAVKKRRAKSSKDSAGNGEQT